MADRIAGEPGSGIPSGPIPSGAGGDLAGNYASPTVVGFRGRPVSASAPTTGDVYTFDGSTWIPQAGGGSGGATLAAGTGLSGGDYDGSTGRTWTVSYGTTSATACRGDDARLSDARAPTAHASTHATGGTDALSLSGAQIATGTVAYGRLPVGTTANTIAAGDDSRLSDSRAPSGSASGDLTGSYPGPTVAKLRGRSVAATAPTDGQALIWDNAGTTWKPGSPSAPDPLTIGTLNVSVIDAQVSGSYIQFGGGSNATRIDVQKPLTFTSGISISCNSGSTGLDFSSGTGAFKPSKGDFTYTAGSSNSFYVYTTFGGVLLSTSGSGSQVILDGRSGVLFRRNGTLICDVGSTSIGAMVFAIDKTLFLARDTATGAAGAAQIDQQTGQVTTESLSLTAGAEIDYTVTCNKIGTGSSVFVSVGNGTNTVSPVYFHNVRAGAGFFKVLLKNGHPTDALNGNLKINFVAFG